MCLAIPAEIVDIDGEQATVSLAGVMKNISLALVDDITVGDFVLVHVGYALNKIDDREARRTLQLMAEAGMLDGRS